MYLGTLIALLHEGQPILGCINQPILEQFVLGDGAVTQLNGLGVPISDVSLFTYAALLTLNGGDTADAIYDRISDIMLVENFR